MAFTKFSQMFRMKPLEQTLISDDPTPGHVRQCPQQRIEAGIQATDHEGERRFQILALIDNDFVSFQG